MEIGLEIGKTYPELALAGERINFPGDAIGVRTRLINNKKIQASLRGQALDKYQECLEAAAMKFTDPEVSAEGHAIVRDPSGKIMAFVRGPQHVLWERISHWNGQEESGSNVNKAAKRDVDGKIHGMVDEEDTLSPKPKKHKHVLADGDKDQQAPSAKKSKLREDGADSG